MQPDQDIQNNIKVAEKTEIKEKSSKGMLFGLILCAVLAVGGIGFGVWAMIDGNTRTDSLNSQITSLREQNSNLLDQVGDIVTDEDVNIVSNDINNALAQNLIAPYIGIFNFLNNVFDYDFSEDVKVEVAYHNLSPVDIVTDRISYQKLNNKYKELFGGDLEKRDYEIGHSDSFSFVIDDNGVEDFIITEYYGGGTELGIFSVVKDAHYDAIGNVVVDVYHDTLPICRATDDEYCIEDVVVDSIEQSNIKDLISKFDNRIPIYKMSFVNDGGHYVLKAIEKHS